MRNLQSYWEMLLEYTKTAFKKPIGAVAQLVGTEAYASDVKVRIFSAPHNFKSRTKNVSVNTRKSRFGYAPGSQSSDEEA